MRPIPRSRPTTLRYGLAMLAVTVSLLVSIWLRPHSFTTPYLFFYPAVILSLWFGGLWPGLLATLLSALVVNFFQLPPHGRFSTDAANVLRTAFFSLTFGVICWLIDRNRSRTEDALLASEHDVHTGREHLAAIIGSAMDGIITVDRDQRIVLFNKAAEEIFRCPASEAIGQSLDRFIPERFRQVHRTHVEDYGATGRTARSIYSPATLTALRADGEEFPVEITISRVNVGGEQLYTAILRDITQRRRTEGALIQSEKLASVGRLAATVAHEINNPLDAVTGLLYLLKNNPSLDDAARHYVEMAEVEVENAAQITRQTLGFSKSRAVVSRFQPTMVMRSVLELFERRLDKKGVTCEKEFSTNLAVGGIEAEIRQVFWNLLTNSLDAVPPHGRIKVRISASLSAAGAAGVRITVADNGHGIDADKLLHLFEPFFTTKENGTGLGLWVSRSLVEKHGGRLRVRSIPGIGAAFSIFLPAILPVHLVDDLDKMSNQAGSVLTSKPSRSA
jgi:PAS domain S-box-containing protein